MIYSARGSVLKAKNRKPLPLTTVELQQSGSRLLHMTPKQILDVKLYHDHHHLHKLMVFVAC